MRPRLLKIFHTRGCELTTHHNQFNNKTILILGASSGIGEAFAHLISQTDAKLILVARNLVKLETMAQKFKSHGINVKYYSVDLNATDKVNEWLDEMILKDKILIDHVILSAGKSIRRTIANTADKLDDITRSIDVNYRSPCIIIQRLLSHQLPLNHPFHITSLSTVTIKYPPIPRWSLYYSAKAGLDLWLRTFDLELRTKGFTVTRIYLPLVHTRMSQPNKNYKNMPGMYAEDAAKSILLGLTTRTKQISPWWAYIVQFCLLFLYPLFYGIIKLHFKISEQKENNKIN